MEEALVTLLMGTAALAALVGNRINWVQAVQGCAVPYVVLTRVSGTRDYKMTGPTGLVESRVQADCFGLTYASAKGVARKVEAALSGYSGAVGAVKFDGIFLATERDLFNDDESPAKRFAVSLDFMVWHKEN